MEQIKVLITGGAGFIGYHLAKSFENDPRYSVLIIDDFSRGKHDDAFAELTYAENIDYLRIDLTDDYDLDEINWDFDYVYHLAAVNGTKNFYNNPSKVLETNIISTINILNCIENTKCKKFIFSSTCETYYGTINRFGEEFLPTNEEVPLTIDNIYNPRSSYAISKIANESTIINACFQSNIPFNILRYHNVYGERMGDCHVIPEVIERIKKEKDILKLYGADQTRSFMYVDDCIRDTRKVGESEFKNEIFNIGIQKETKIRDIAKRLIEYSGKEMSIVDNGFPVGSVQRRLPDMKKFKEYFGRSKNVSLSEGLLKTYLWYAD